jgi:hypothetical protein
MKEAVEWHGGRLLGRKNVASGMFNNVRSRDFVQVCGIKMIIFCAECSEEFQRYPRIADSGIVILSPRLYVLTSGSN